MCIELKKILFVDGILGCLENKRSHMALSLASVNIGLRFNAEVDLEKKIDFGN